MSECMTIADETIDQKDTCTEITPKSIVDFILEETLLSVFVNSDKGCSRIGDFNTADVFGQDQPPYPKDFEQIDHSRKESTANQESNLNSGENVDRSARENLEILIDSFVKKEDKFKHAGECTVITEEILAKNELQIQNGKIHLEKNGNEGKNFPKTEKNKDEDDEEDEEDSKIEREYFEDEMLNKIYFQQSSTNGSDVGTFNVDGSGQESEDGGRTEVLDGSEEVTREDDLERPFKPFTTEELRQVWGNGNSSLVGKWDGDALVQREGAVRLMEELSSVHVFSDSSADPNRPRACAFAEEDVRKIIKEIEEISFTQCHANSEDLDVAYHPDGQGDADLEVKSSTKSKDTFVKSQKSKGSESSATPDHQESFTISTANDPSSKDKKASRKSTNDIKEEYHLEYEVTGEERELNSTLCNENTENEGSSTDVISDSKNHPDSISGSDGSNSLIRLEQEMSKEFRSMSGPLFGTPEDLSGSKIDELRLKNSELASELDVKPCPENWSDLMKELQKGCNNPMRVESGTQQDVNSSFDFHDQKNTRNGEELTNHEVAEEVLNAEFPNENGLADGSDPKKFKLTSQKMYLSPNYELPNRSPNDFGLTESEEAFIDLMESVIQIIDPPENNTEEDSNQISFSLVTDIPKSAPSNTEADSEVPVAKNISSCEVVHPTKRVYSGMTTIGPMKNIEHDPKDLTSPDIDYGKMTRITSSRQLAKDFGLFSGEATSIKILVEDFTEDSASGNTEDDRAERTSLVNRDIASLTKVQKIREVMSYQPKAEEDFEDEEVLARPRLDLKDVESMTDERYKVPEVPIPLLSFEIGETDLNPEKELIDSMGLVISGLTNPAYYEEEIEDDEENQDSTEEEYKEPLKSSDDKLLDKESLINVTKDEETSLVNSGKESSGVSNDDQEQEGDARNQKYGTLGSVFRKASKKFLRKDGDLLMRNSKSLPRDASRIINTDSIRSMLDDCHSSASNMLKKSRSLLKNTQGVFKSISQSRMSSDAGPKKPLSPSESDMITVEKKFSGLLKKEDFTKARNLIKEKVEKAFKNFETNPEQETVSDKRNLLVVVRKENLQVDRFENFKKVLPKTPLVYKSQFVKSQMNVQSKPQEKVGAVSKAVAEEDPKNSQEALNSPTEDVSEKILHETDLEEQSDSEKQDKMQWINSEEDVKSEANEEFEQEQPDYIVMETVQGLLSSDLESPSSEKENLNVENTVKVETGGNDQKKIEASHSLQTFSEGGRDIVPCLTESEDEKTQTKPLERKIKTKKKFTARFRSFWCSAFGRVKTSTGKDDLS